ncbi:hypothetical protein J6590_103451, partial [Homalodisca vitripennis]
MYHWNMGVSTRVDEFSVTRAMVTLKCREGARRTVDWRRLPIFQPTPSFIVPLSGFHRTAEPSMMNQVEMKRLLSYLACCRDKVGYTDGGRFQHIKTQARHLFGSADSSKWNISAWSSREDPAPLHKLRRPRALLWTILPRRFTHLDLPNIFKLRRPRTSSSLFIYLLST